MINCIGQMFGTSGYSSHFRSLVNELNKLTKCKIVTNLHPNYERDVNDAELEMIKREQDYDINLVITHPVNWKSNLSAKRNWVYLIWEGDTIPKWIAQECMNDNIEKIIVPSEHTLKAIVTGLDKIKAFTEDKIVVIPHGVDLKTFHPIKQKKSDTFKFLANKGLRNLEDRGGLQYLIKAYLEEFKKSDNVELILKINPAYEIPNIIEMFPELESKDAPDVRLITDNYTVKQLNELYNECDVFVSPTRAESFNLPCLEAMACGKPVITTSFGGQTDFCTNFTGRILSGKLTEVTHELEYEGIKWLTPDHSLLKECLRYMYNENPDTKDKCLETAKKFTWENTAKQINSLINR